MATTVSTSPTYPIPGRQFRVTYTNSSATRVDVVCTAAPTASKWAQRLEAEDRGEIQIHSVPCGETHDLEFDVAGAYVCTLRAFTRTLDTFGGGYADYAKDGGNETFVDETSHTFYVGQKMTGQVRVGDDRGELVLYVWEDTIRATDVEHHGEKTPRLDATTDGMRAAAETSAVSTALAALEDVAASTAASDLETVANDLISNFTAHAASTTFHASADTTNATTKYRYTKRPGSLAEAATGMARALRAHVTNDAGSGVGTASFHNASDFNGIAAVEGASDALTTGQTLAAIWTAYETHRQNSTAHASADTTNAAAALPELLEVYRQIIDVVDTDDPTAPSTDNAAATLLVSRAGLSKA